MLLRGYRRPACTRHRTRAPYPASDKTAQQRETMSWVVLIVSGMFEAVWATALGRSEGFSRPAPTAVFLLGLLVSMGGLALALRELPTGTAYAVWVGIGAVTTATWAMAVDGEAVSVAKVMLLAGIVGCVMGLRAIE